MSVEAMITRESIGMVRVSEKFFSCSCDNHPEHSLAIPILEGPMLIIAYFAGPWAYWYAC